MNANQNVSRLHLLVLTRAGVSLSTTATVRGSMTNSITAHHSIAHPPDPLEICSPVRYQAMQSSRGKHNEQQDAQSNSCRLCLVPTCGIGINRFARFESTAQQLGRKLAVSARTRYRLHFTLVEMPDLSTGCNDLASVHSRAYCVRAASELTCPKQMHNRHRNQKMQASQFHIEPRYNRCSPG